MNQFEMIVVGLLLAMVFGMFVIGKWVMAIMANSRLINRKIEQHNLIDLELRFFRFLHFNGEKEEGSKYYLGKIIKTFNESESDYMDEKEKESYNGIYRKFLKHNNIDQEMIYTIFYVLLSKQIELQKFKTGKMDQNEQWNIKFSECNNKIEDPEGGDDMKYGELICFNEDKLDVALTER